MVYKVRRGVNLCMDCGKIYLTKQGKVVKGPRGGRSTVCPLCGQEETKCSGNPEIKSVYTARVFLALLDEFNNEFCVTEEVVNNYRRRAQALGIPWSVWSKNE